MKKILTLLFLVGFLHGAYSQTSELIISEYVEGWSNNKALELFNVTDHPIELIEYRLIRYSNGDDVPPAIDSWTVSLPDETLEPYQTFVIAIDQRNPDGTGQTAPVWMQLQQRANAFLCPDYNISETMYFNGDDAIVVEKKTGVDAYTIHDIFGRWGPPAPALAQFVGSDKMDNAWTNVSPYMTGEGVAITAEHTMIRKSTVTTGITANPSIFNPLADWDTLSANTFDHLGWHKFDNAPANETPALVNESLLFGISPTAKNGAEIGTVEATDAEQDELKFYIDYGNFIYIDDVRVEPFEINKSTGVISLVDETGLAPEILDTFYVSINITDGYSQLGPVTATIIVTDDNVSVQSKISSDLKVFPNPVTENQFQLKANKSIKEISLSNMIGQIIITEHLSQNVYERIINLENKIQGVYLLNVKYSDNTFETKKLLVK